MHIKPIPLGLVFLGVCVMYGSFSETIDWIQRNPIWSMQNWRHLMRGAIRMFICGVLLLVAGIVGFLV